MNDKVKSMTLKDHFIKSIADELDNLNGTEFEQLCLYFIELVTKKEFEQKGHNLEMKPVKGSSDLLVADSHRIIGQCGTDKDYFSGEKPLKDVQSSIKNNPGFTTIFLFSNRRAKGNELTKVRTAVYGDLKKNKITGYHCNIYDSQRIANKIYDNIYQTEKIVKILSFLPMAFGYYVLLPQTNTVPMPKTSYKVRPEEDEIKKRLEKEDFIQIYGLSGIGKTQIAMAIANDIARQYETVLWFDGKNVNPGDFKNVNIQRLNKNINLKYVLNSFHVLIIVDNLNEDVNKLMENFIRENKQGSRCIVTSLHRTGGEETSFQLSFVSDDVSKDILCDSKIPPSEDQVSLILTRIHGYPLLLELSKNAVENKDLSWEEIIEISNITDITDEEKNVEFATRIVGTYKDRFSDVFNLIYGLDSTTISKLFLRNFSLPKFPQLFKTAILQDDGEYVCSIHQVVLNAIKKVYEKEYSKDSFYEYIFTYLNKHAVVKNANFYTFLTYHKDQLLAIASQLETDDLLRHYIILSYVYAVDTFDRPSYYIALIDQLKLEPEKNEVDLRLNIEKLEIEQSILKEEKKKDESKTKEYREKIMTDIETLQKMNTSAFKFPAYINHHIGKMYSSIEDYENAEIYLRKALENNPKSYRSRLILARNFRSQKNHDKVAKEITIILNAENIKEVPVSVRLGAYDIISVYDYRDLREQFIDNQLEQFTKDIIATLSEDYSQTYVVLAKLSSHWAFNFPKEYSIVCIQLPLPLDIEHDVNLRKNYGKIILAQCLYCDYSKEYKDKLVNIADEYLSAVPEKDDFLIRDLMKLYLEANIPEKALRVSEEIKDRENLFSQQLLCKTYLKLGEVNRALDCIAKAIAQEDHQKKEYCAAFRHDKALCLFTMTHPKAEEIMEEAISLHPNEKVKELWQKELDSFRKTAHTDTPQGKDDIS